MSTVRTRFAPSPTGYMHVGGIRTALFGWLVARQNGGQFILRLEDTDQAREVAGADEHIMRSLKALGLEYDEGPDKPGPHGPYRQSERLETYKEWAQKLVDAGRAYADPYSPEEVDAFRKASEAAKKPFLFREYRPDAPPEWDGSQPLRFKSDPKRYEWHDEVMGDLSAGEGAVDDFIILKSDGFPTYNFAHIVDDLLMECTHIIRGQEFLASVPRFLNLYEALGITPPVMATMPLILGPDGKHKLSKRDGAKDVLDYLAQGYLPEAMVNFIASLGWNDGSEQEIFSVEELIKKFSLDRVQRSGALFDERRLLWMNGAHIRSLAPDELAKRAEPFWPEETAVAGADYRQRILLLVQERLKYFGELPEQTSFFFTEPSEDSVRTLLHEPADKQLKKADRSTFKPMLEAVRAELDGSDFSEADIAARLNALLDSLATKPGVLFALVRIAVTGSAFSPQLFGTLAVLGKETALARLDRSIALL
jgi:glutamyl-tRNA synthetase